MGDEEWSCRNETEAFQLKMVAIAAILVGSIAGVCIPIAGKTRTYLRVDSPLFFLIKSFAAGVILATGFVHVLPDAFSSLTSQLLPQDPWSKFPFAGFIAMLAALLTLLADVCATAYYRSSAAVAASVIPVTEPNHEENDIKSPFIHSHLGHAHLQTDSSALLRHKVVAQVLELGIVAHSVIIGLSLGASDSTCTIRPLVVALAFHQFFEGMGLGGCIAQAALKNKATAAMAIIFSLTTPAGVVLGIGVSSAYNENSPTALVVEGILNSASAGILIYMALVDLIATDYHSDKMTSYSALIQVGAFVALFLGTGSMSALAYWA